MEIKYNGAAFGFVRGFVHSVTCSWQWFLNHSALIAKSTIREVELTTRPGVETKNTDRLRLVGCKNWYFQLPTIHPDELNGFSIIQAALLKVEFPGLTFRLVDTNTPR